MKFLRWFCLLIFLYSVTTRVCDLCGCFTPQVNAMAAESPYLPDWVAGFYGAIAEQFTSFGTLQLDGAHQYHFANDLTLASGPGYYLIHRPDTLAGLQFEVSGEYKDVDRFQGKPAEDTDITSVFVEPRVVVAHGRWSAEVAVDLPVLIDNTALQAVPDYRLHGGIAVQF